MHTNTHTGESRQSPVSDTPRSASLPGLLARQMVRAPDAPAVQDGGRTYSYEDLDDWSRSISQALLSRAVRPGDAVAVLGTRSWEATVATVGILRAGAVCVPVDAQYPSAQAAEMLSDAGARLAIALPGHEPVATAGDEPVGWEEFDALVRTRPTVDHDPDFPSLTERSAENCAYVLFTSGTTGRPKPVLFPHRAVTRLAEGGAPWCPGSGKRVLQTFGLSFDGSLFEMWATLLNGGCLVVTGRDVLLDTEALGSLLRAERITHAFMTTSLFHHSVRTKAGIFGALDMVLVGGEAMDPGLAAAVCATGRPRHLINGYGPTEGGIMVSAYDVGHVAPDASSVPIGWQVAASSCHLLRADGSPAGPGEEGEICIGGAGLALGYLNRPEETARAFVTLPTSTGESERLYRSGDLARRGGDGLLEFRGRVDRQVKVRGFRVELDAVEALLRTHPGVADAAVIVRGNDGIGKGLSAFVTSADPTRPVRPAQLRAHLASRLPTHAIPAPIHPLERMPLTGNGKTDYAELRTRAAAPDRGSGQPPADRPGDPVAEIWAEVLGTPVSDSTDFFAEGGNSLLAAQAVTRTIAALGLTAEHFAPLLQRLLAAPALAAYRTATGTLPSGPSGPSGSSGPDDRTQPDYEAEAGIELNVGAGPDSAPQPTRARHVLLTGATGFVGAFLLERLLRDTDAIIHCPVRAADDAQAMRRIHATMKRFGLRLGEPGRVRPLPAELGRPGLGMAPGVLGGLADDVDLIVHSAAHVNFLYPYQQLREANVEAVRSLLDLAAGRRIPLHYVSTTAVLSGSGAGGVRYVDESTPLSHPELISMGYPETKWVAERMLGHAAEAGLPVTIHRPYEITGHSRTGAWNTSTAICAVFDAIAHMGSAPAVPLPLDLVPVDTVTDAIVGIATRLPHLGGVVHLTNPRPARLSDMVDRMRAAGYAIEDVSYAEWTAALVDHVRRNPEAPIAPFLPLFVTPANETGHSVKELYFDTVFPEVARTRTDQIWPAWRDSCPPVDDTLLDGYLSCLRRSGLLSDSPQAAPERRARLSRGWFRVLRGRGGA
ncbi:non-ribosomal peptide synthetase [Streptomyces sp. RTd22]|uniref:non-ribosomal peptide synthetase n=1 Tax=Streptomyces sp. RTd22 TaxID=1841249 RepID=UPI0007C4EF05|nr:amino acid adenylation domain-containing protein [Streptomyces sp. RTd22]